MCSKIFVILTLLGVAVSVTYRGYKVYKIAAKTETENEFLRQMALNDQFDFWSKINKIGSPVTVMVAPPAQEDFETELRDLKMEYAVEIDDVQRTIDNEAEYHRSRALPNGRISFDQYLRYEEITSYLAQLGNDYPNLVRISSIGHSYEDRTMNIITISDGTGPKPVFVIEAGMFGREWISTALALYIINQLVENEDNLNLLTNLDWIVVPSMNPDGYEYTWTTDRMWRKTRSPGVQCNGTNGNRNFGFHWMEQGASDQECNETYAGTSAFSEIECANLRDLLNVTENIVGYVSIHTWGQILFYPYGYDFEVVPDNQQELYDLGRSAGDAIFAVNGTAYYVGLASEVYYLGAGSSDDWAMGGAGINIVLTFELPGGGSNGFDLQPEKILPVVTETWEGIKVIADHAAQTARRNQRSK